MNTSSITYQEFLDGIKAKILHVGVDRYKAGKFVMSEFGDKYNKPAHVFWRLVAFTLIFVLPFILFIYKGWVYAIGSLLSGFMVNRASYSSAVDFVKSNMLENEEFCEYVIENNGAVVYDENMMSVQVIFQDQNKTTRDLL